MCLLQHLGVAQWKNATDGGLKGNETSGHSSLDGVGALMKEAAGSVSVRLARHFGFLPSPMRGCGKKILDGKRGQEQQVC